MIHYHATNFKAYCYYFLEAPGGFNVAVTGKGLYIILFTLLGMFSFVQIPMLFSRQYKKEHAEEIRQQLQDMGG